MCQRPNPTGVHCAHQYVLFAIDGTWQEAKEIHKVPQKSCSSDPQLLGTHSINALCNTKSLIQTPRTLSTSGFITSVHHCHISTSLYITVMQRCCTLREIEPLTPWQSFCFRMNGNMMLFPIGMAATHCFQSSHCTPRQAADPFLSYVIACHCVVCFAKSACLA